MVAPTVKTISRYNVSQEHLIKDSFGKYIEYKHVEKHMTQESATLLAAVAKVRELTAERDRLAAENAELKALCIDNTISVLQDKLSAANAALDALREAVPEAVNSRPYDVEHLRGSIWHILYSKETGNDDR